MLFVLLLISAAFLNIGFSYRPLRQPKCRFSSHAIGEDEEFLSFSSITSLESLQKQYNSSNIVAVPVESFTESRNLMCMEAYKVIAGRLAPQLAYSSSLVALDNEKSRYFMIYEIIKEISRLGNRLSMTLEDKGAVTVELTGVQTEGTEMGTDEVSVWINLLLSNI